MKTNILLILMVLLAATLFCRESLATCTWSQTGNITAVDGSNMPTSFSFKMDVDSGAWSDNPGAYTYANEWVRYDGIYSDNTVTANTKIVFAQALAAMLSWKTVYNCGPSAYTDGGRDLVSEQMYVTSDQQKIFYENIFILQFYFPISHENKLCRCNGS